MSELRASMSFYNNQGYGRPQQPPMRSSHEQQMMRSRCADAHTRASALRAGPLRLVAVHRTGDEVAKCNKMTSTLL